MTHNPPTFTGSGVPENDNVKKPARHGYWKRQRRYKPGKGKRTPVTDAWYFYYTGTGPFADLKWGQLMTILSGLQLTVLMLMQNLVKGLETLISSTNSLFALLKVVLTIIFAGTLYL